MTWSLRSLLREYSGLLVWALVLVVLTFHEYDPDRYIANRSELRALIAPALHTVRNAHLLWFGFGFGLLLLVLRALAFRVQGLSLRGQVTSLGLLLALYAAGGWLGERGLQRYLAAEYYTIWKYQYGEKFDQPVLSAPTLLPRVLQDVQNPAEPWHSRDKLAFQLGFAGAQPAFPVLQALARDSTQHPELRLHCLLALRLLDRPRLRALLPTLPADTAVALFRQHTQREQ